MPTINLENVSILNRPLLKNQGKLSAMYSGIEIALATYQLLPKEIFLGWIETNEQYQGNGVASLLLDYLCQMSLDSNCQLVIKVADAKLLDSFYLNWYQKKVDPNGEFSQDVSTKFSSLVYDSYFHPKLMLSPQDLSWKPTVNS